MAQRVDPPRAPQQDRPDQASGASWIVRPAQQNGCRRPCRPVTGRGCFRRRAGCGRGVGAAGLVRRGQEVLAAREDPRPCSSTTTRGRTWAGRSPRRWRGWWGSGSRRARRSHDRRELERRLTAPARPAPTTMVASVSGRSAFERTHDPQLAAVEHLRVGVDHGRTDVLGAIEAGERWLDVADPGASSLPRGCYTADPCLLANAGKPGITQLAGCVVTLDNGITRDT